MIKINWYQRKEIRTYQLHCGWEVLSTRCSHFQPEFSSPTCRSRSFAPPSRPSLPCPVPARPPSCQLRAGRKEHRIRRCCSLTFLSLHHKNFTHWNSLWSYQPRSKEAITAFPERRSSRSCAREEVEPWCSPTDRSGSPSNRRSRNSSPHKRGSGSC